MQAPFEMGATVRITFTSGTMIERPVIDWGEQGIVTANESHIQFIPFHRINSIVAPREAATSPHRDRGFAATAGVG